jgi:hypothetical protein
LFVRLGDLGSTGAVFIGSLLGLGTSGYAILNVAACAFWIFVALRLRKLSSPARPQQPNASASVA